MTPLLNAYRVTLARKDSYVMTHCGHSAYDIASTLNISEELAHGYRSTFDAEFSSKMDRAWDAEYAAYNRRQAARAALITEAGRLATL